MNRTLSLPAPRLLRGTLLALLLLALLPGAVWAQDDTGTANAEAREQVSAMFDEAGALAEMTNDAASLMQAAMKYLEAAEVAATSGDAELAERAKNAKEQAVKAYVDAGSVLSAAEDHGAAAEAFDKAADVAEDLGDAELEAKAKYNASVAYVSLKDFENAISAIDRAIVLIPSDLNYLYVKGIAQRSGGDLDGSNTTFARLDTLATEAGDDAMVAKARENLGKAHLLAANDAIKAKQYQSGIDHLDMAVPYLGEDDKTLNTLYANAYYRMGADQVQKEQLGPAESSLRKGKTHAEKAGNQKLINGIQQQLDYIAQVKSQ